MNRTTARSACIIALAAMVLLVAAGCSRQPRIVWSQRFESGKGDIGTSVATDGKDIIVGGMCNDVAAKPGQTAWEILRYDKKGKLQWQRTYDRGRCDSLAAVAAVWSHDIMGVGWTSSGRAGDSVRLLLARFSAEGDVKWCKEYAYGLSTRATAVSTALSVDSLDRIMVCGTVKAGRAGATSDILMLRFDGDGILADRETLDCGGDEYALDMVQFSNGGSFLVAGRRIPGPGMTDSLARREALLLSLDADLHLLWSQSYDPAGRNPIVRLANRVVSVTSQNDSGNITRVLELGGWHGRDMEIVHDTPYARAWNATCLALAPDHGGGTIGVGSIGPTGEELPLAWRYFRGGFTRILPGCTCSDTISNTRGWLNDVATDAEGGIVATGVSGSGIHAGILTLKVVLPRYKPPPDFWLPNMHR
jgi:hypothetical protein